MPIGRPISLTPNVQSKKISVTATADQTLFTVQGGYRINNISVYRNGARLAQGSDFTASDGSTVTLLSAATADDIVAYDLPSDDLTNKDIEALKSELSDPRFADGYWQEQITTMLKLGKKAEQQSLAKYGLDFVTDTYLPEKLAELGLA